MSEYVASASCESYCSFLLCVETPSPELLTMTTTITVTVTPTPTNCPNLGTLQYIKIWSRVKIGSYIIMVKILQFHHFRSKSKFARKEVKYASCSCSSVLGGQLAYNFNAGKCKPFLGNTLVDAITYFHEL